MSVRFEMMTIDDHPDFALLSKQFPELKARMLGYIGKNAAQGLYETMLTGQELQYNPRSHSPSGAPISKSGRRMVSYSISKGLRYVSIASFPLNLFENGRLLRSGERAPAMRILNGKYSSRLSSTLQFMAESWQEIVYTEWQTKYHGNRKAGK